MYHDLANMRNDLHITLSWCVVPIFYDLHIKLAELLELVIVM